MAEIASLYGMRGRPRKNPQASKRTPSLDGWKRAIAKLLRPGFEHAQIALLAAAGAPFMRYVSQQGGAILHFGGAETKGIRAAALAPATSVWNGVESPLAPVIDDDYANFSNLALEDEIARFSQDPAATILIGTSNQLLLTRFKNEREALTARVIEINLRHISSAVLLECDEVRRELIPHVGFAGEILLGALNNKPFCQNIPEFAALAAKELTLRFPYWDEECRFWRWAIVAMMIGSGALNKLGLIRYNATDALEWLYELLVSRRARDTRTPPAKALLQCLTWANEQKRVLHIAGPPPQSKTSMHDPKWKTVRDPRPKGAVCVRHEYKKDIYYVSWLFFEQWCAANNNSALDIARALKLEKTLATLNAGYPSLRSLRTHSVVVPGEKLGRPAAPATSQSEAPDGLPQSADSDRP